MLKQMVRNHQTYIGLPGAYAGTEVVVMPPAELEEKLAAAREEVAGPIRQVLVAGGECALWVAVNEALTKGGTARVIPASETGAANVAYAARIAAVEAAEPAPECEPKPASKTARYNIIGGETIYCSSGAETHLTLRSVGRPLDLAGVTQIEVRVPAVCEAAKAAPSPCACKSAEWVDGWWRWPTAADPTVHCNTGPGDACPDCHEPLPPKPVEGMTIEECAAELATAPARTWYVSPRCGHWYVYDGLPSEVGWFVKCATALDAWRAAVRKLREEGS